jgi:hypothetical protein
MRQVAQHLLFGRFLNFTTVVVSADSVLFGRFLNFGPMGPNDDSLPANLTNNNRAARCSRANI